MTPRREQLGMQKRTSHISVDQSVRACVNCEYYEQYYHRGRGNVATWVPTCTGYCLIRDEQRGPLRQPCKEFEQKEVVT